MDSNNILQMFGYYWDHSKNQLIIVLEYCDMGSIFDACFFETHTQSNYNLKRGSTTILSHTNTLYATNNNNAGNNNSHLGIERLPTQSADTITRQPTHSVTITRVRTMSTAQYGSFENSGHLPVHIASLRLEIY